MRVIEVGAVVYGGLGSRGTAKDLGLPRIEVRVKVYDADGTVGVGDGA